MPAVDQLRGLIFAAHDASARRDNASTQALRLAAGGSGDYTKAISAALSTLGGNHGPLRQTQELLELGDPAAEAAAMVRRGEKVPGWGNSFVRGGHDPLWDGVRRHLIDFHRDTWDLIEEVTRALHAAGKCVYPNPSAYTAAFAIIVGIPPAACASLFVAARLSAWTDIFLKTIGG